MCWLSFCAGIEPFSLSSDQLPAANLTLQLLEECFSLRSDIFSISPAALPTPSTRCGGSPLLLEVASAVALTTRASEMINLIQKLPAKPCLMNLATIEQPRSNSLCKAAKVSPKSSGLTWYSPSAPGRVAGAPGLLARACSLDNLGQPCTAILNADAQRGLEPSKTGRSCSSPHRAPLHDNGIVLAVRRRCYEASRLMIII